MGLQRDREKAQEQQGEQKPSAMERMKNSVWLNHVIDFGDGVEWMVDGNAQTRAREGGTVA